MKKKTKRITKDTIKFCCPGCNKIYPAKEGVLIPWNSEGFITYTICKKCKESIKRLDIESLEALTYCQNWE